MVEQIALYANKDSPFSHRAEIALAQAKADYKKYEISFKNKPEWFASKVNPVAKVPALAYGGPDVPPDQPSSESAKLAESLVLVEFVADLFPNSGLLPADAVQRAQIRFFIDAVSTKFFPPWLQYVVMGGPGSSYVDAVLALEKTLVGRFAVGDHFTAADVALVPLLLRAEIASEFKGSKDVRAKIQERAPRFWKYYQDVKTYPSVASTWNADAFREFCRRRSEQQ